MHSHHKHAINTSGDDAMNRIPQAQPGIALLECPWDPLKKEGVEGHSRECRREREREGIPTWTEDPPYSTLTYMRSTKLGHLCRVRKRDTLSDEPTETICDERLHRIPGGSEDVSRV